MKRLRMSLIYRYLDGKETFLSSTSSEVLQLQCAVLNHLIPH